MLLVLLAACTASESPRPPEPSGLPTGPAHGTVTLSSGSAQVSLSGDVEAERVLDGVSAPAIYRPLPATVTVAWGVPGRLVIAGPLRLGDQHTSAALVLELTLRIHHEEVEIVSANGECSVAVERADDRSFSGSFSCHGLGGRAIVNATGSFEASA